MSHAVSVPIPPGMPVGVVIGKGGQHVQQIRQQTGARVNVRAEAGDVLIMGANNAVQAAVDMLQHKFQEFLTSRSQRARYAVPMEVFYLLHANFGQDVRSTVRFVAADDEAAQEVAAAASSGKSFARLCSLQPDRVLPAPSPAGHDDDDEALAAAMAGMALGGRPKGTGVYLSTQQPTVLRGFITAAKRAAEHSSTHFDEMKIRFNFGKNMFCKGGIDDGATWDIKQMQDLRVPQDYNSRYSNAVKPEHLAKLKDWLTAEGFTQVETKHTISVHILKRGAKDHYGLSFIKQGSAGGSLTLRKVKTGNSKLAFLVLLNEPQHPDWRAKLLAQNKVEHDLATQRMLDDIAATATLEAPSKLHFSDMPEQLYVDKERHKSKTIYQGVFSGSATSSSSVAASTSAATDVWTLIRVTISAVRTADSDAETYEVAGSSPEVNELLMGLLRCGRLSRDEEHQLLQHLKNVLAFATAAAVA